MVCLFFTFFACLFTWQLCSFPLSFSPYPGMWATSFGLGTCVGATVGGVLVESLGFRAAAAAFFALYVVVIAADAAFACLNGCCSHDERRRGRRRRADDSSDEEEGRLLKPAD